MKFGILILAYIIIPISLYGQSFKISVNVSPLMSIYGTDPDQINSEERKFHFGFSSGASFEYYYTRYFAMGTGVFFSLIQGEFYTPCFCISTADRRILTRNILSTYNFEIPLYIKLRLSKNESKFFYAQGGIALNWLVYAKRKVEIETHLLNGTESQSEEIVNETFSLQNKNNNSIGSSFQFGIGRSFPIKKMNFYFEFAFRKDINYWKYIAYQAPSVVEDFHIKNSSLLLKLGVFLKK